MIIHEKIIELLKKENISFQIYKHEPILTYEDAEKQKQKFNWEGVESKNVFMTNKKGKYFLFVTVQGEKVNFNKMKKILGEKLSIASVDEVKNVAKCVPGCVAPFGLDNEIFTIIDKKIFGLENYLFSPGITTETIQVDPKKLLKIFEKLDNKVFI